MKNETAKRLSEFNIITSGEILLSKAYKPYENYLKQTLSGEGMVGENNYLLLWEKSEIEELNNMYETHKFVQSLKNKW